MFKIFSTYYLLNKYIKSNFRGQRCSTTPIWVVRRQRVNRYNGTTLLAYTQNSTGDTTMLPSRATRIMCPAWIHTACHLSKRLSLNLGVFISTSGSDVRQEKKPASSPSLVHSRTSGEKSNVIHSHLGESQCETNPLLSHGELVYSRHTQINWVK